MAKKELAPDAESRIKQCADEGGTDLDLRDLGLTELPHSGRELRGLQSLQLDLNHLSTLPDWIAELKELHILTMRNNAFPEVPEAIRGLPDLSILYIGANRIATLPDWIGDLQRLEYLGLELNLLRSAPLESRSAQAP